MRSSLTMLGGFRLTVGGVEVELPAGIQRVIALVALRGRMSRSRIAGTLWPETSEQRALASLRTSMWRINQASPRLVVTVGTMTDLDPDVQMDVRDVVWEGLLLMQEDAPGHLTGHTVFEAGELLPDWEDDWLVHDRERLRQLRLHALEALVERLAARGRFGLALDMALAVLRSDALRESAHRSVIRVHLAEGNVGEARRAYALCCEILHRELGVVPSAATARAAAELHFVR